MVASYERDNQYPLRGEVDHKINIREVEKYTKIGVVVCNPKVLEAMFARVISEGRNYYSGIHEDAWDRAAERRQEEKADNFEKAYTTAVIEEIKTSDNPWSILEPMFEWLESKYGNNMYTKQWTKLLKTVIRSIPKKMFIEQIVPPLIKWIENSNHPGFIYRLVNTKRVVRDERIKNVVDALDI
ncbi:MAG: hypothetical protein ACXAD7_16435 [Candidatus Kariarchaeaceae archaeon]|jgi:hypothetical protein